MRVKLQTRFGLAVWQTKKRELLRICSVKLKKKHKKLSLKFIEKMPDEVARDYLQQFRGIGPKTVACTLLFACHKEVFPLDTHIFRVSQKNGNSPGKNY